MSIYQKLSAVQNELRLERTGFNPHFRSDYFTLGDILNKLRPLLSKNKLCLFQGIEGSNVTTTVVDMEKEDAKISSSITIPSGLDMQKQGSAISYAKRYLLTGLFLVEERTDDDGEAAVGRGSVAPTAQKVEATTINPGTTNITTAPSTPTTTPTEKKKVSFSKKAFTPKAAPAAEVKSTDDDL